ncbi:MAG: 4-hydroxy-tetrahydrodipicolinate reductase, partial [Myxococcota bacterium]|nr:4-hydroxy-tetrahydrodipicolinate reductase [Myxococcota bacterium]
MSERPLPLVLHGAAGRMGREVAAAARDEPGVAIAIALDAVGHPDLGRPLVDARGRSGPPDLSCSLSAAPAGAVVIDFSTPAALRALIEALLADPRPLVSGTTGIGPGEESMLDDLARVAPVIHAPNMSVGVAAVRAAAAMLTRALGDGFDVEIVEIHHSAKKDAPSGTALALARSVAAAAGSGGRLVCRAPTAG